MDVTEDQQETHRGEHDTHCSESAQDPTCGTAGDSSEKEDGPVSAHSGSQQTVAVTHTTDMELEEPSSFTEGGQDDPQQFVIQGQVGDAADAGYPEDAADAGDAGDAADAEHAADAADAAIKIDAGAGNEEFRSDIAARLQSVFSRKMWRTRRLECWASFRDCKQAILRCKLAFLARRRVSPDLDDNYFWRLPQRLSHLERKLKLEAKRLLSKKPLGTEQEDDDDGEEEEEEAVVVCQSGKMVSASTYLEEVSMYCPHLEEYDLPHVTSFSMKPTGTPTVLFVTHDMLRGKDDPEVWFEVASTALMSLRRC